MNAQPLFNSDIAPAPFPLIDIHIHIGPSDTGELFYPHLTADEYREIMYAFGISHACAFAPMRHDGYLAANEALAAHADKDDSKILPFARLGGGPMPVTAPHLWMVRRKIKSFVKSRPRDLARLDDLARFRGVKMLPHMDGLVERETLEEIDRLGLPVVAHGGTHSSARFLMHNVGRFIRSPFIIAHCGSFPCDLPLLHEAIDIAERNEHVFLDTSGVWISEFLRYAVSRIPHKLVFGSDAPLAHPMVAWHHLASVVTNDATLERIGYRNAKCILGL